MKPVGEPKVTAAEGAQPPLLEEPPSIDFIWLKGAVATLKNNNFLPDRLDGRFWHRRFQIAHMQRVVESFHFLGLCDADFAPDARLGDLVSSYNTPDWPEKLRLMIERSYQPVVAKGFGNLSPDRLLVVFRETYELSADKARNCVAFFVNAAREAAIDLPASLASKRAHLTREPLRPAAATQTHKDIKPVRSKPLSEPSDIALLLAKLPAFDPAWSDEVKTSWFDTYTEIARLASLRPGDA